jgi:hydroxyacylglutathione hydrolase
MRVIPIKLFEDNYSYAVYNMLSQVFFLVDPADWPAVSSFVTSHPELSTRRLTHIFTTHKHWDHSGGNESAIASHPELKIVGGEHDSIPACNLPVADGQELDMENGIHVKVMHVPCHTRGHVLYYMTDNSAGEHAGAPRVVFTGDTLFIGGCGKFFEGDAQEMHAAMEKIRSLPKDTLVYCGHEYTVSNLNWASKIENENQDITHKLQEYKDRIERGEPTVPSSVENEEKINVFMRAGHLASLLGVSDAVSALGTLREWKNQGKTLIN